MTSLTELSVADRYREAAKGFTVRVEETADWDVPTPVAEWRARDIVGHLTTWLPGMLGDAVPLRPGPSVEDDPVAAWHHLDTQVQALLDDPTTAGTEVTVAQIGTHRLEVLLDQYFTSDVVFHTWDLARATGQDDSLDEDFIAGALAGMGQMEEMIRGSGQFGEQQPVPEDATTQERFFAFIGRDPRWTPPTP